MKEANYSKNQRRWAYRDVRIAGWWPWYNAIRIYIKITFSIITIVPSIYIAIRLIIRGKPLETKKMDAGYILEEDCRSINI
jgi:hypothetical protein